MAAGEIQSVSPSQVNTFKLCRRRWRLQKVEGLPEPRGEAATAGENDHRQLENYELTGEPPTSPSAALAILDPAFPPPKHADLLVEYPANFDLGLTAAGIPVRGKIDLVDRRDPKHVIVLDHKTKSPSSFKRKLKPEELARDVQGTVYAKHVFTRYPETEAVTFSHLNLKRVTEADPKPDYKFVSSPAMDREHVDEAYRTEFEAVVEQMKAVAAAETWEEVEPNWSACRLYPPAGCPYVSTCSPSLTVKDAFTKLFAGEESTTMPPEKTTPLPSLWDGSFVLMIDCQPRTPLPGTIFLEDEIQRRSLLVLDEARRLKVKGAEGAKDVRELEFGKGTTALTKSFLENPPTGIVVASNTGLSAQVLEVLKPRASVVIVPTR